MNEHVTEHAALLNILQSRGMEKLQRNYPLWKFKLTDEEYESLKQTLRSHPYDLNRYGLEAALSYAEWWRRDYKGNNPSKEDVAEGIGLRRVYGEDLFMAARSALEKHGYTFLHSLKGTEYFRTLLNQGGLPVNYIINSDGNFGSYSRFLRGLVRELSIIGYDWNHDDHTIIQQFGCISYLGKAFKNENIYDVSMQIAHAIITDDNSLLPYDDTDASLAELTKSLKKEYTRAKRERKIRPLSLHWKLHTIGNDQGQLFVNMDVVKEISSDSIPGLDISTCYSFDVFVSGSLVGKYVRKSNNRDDEGNIVNATYTRISVGVSKDILWKGEPVVEVKVRCDNDDRLFLTIAGCYPPNFDVPQVFQMLDDNVYSKSETAKSEDNIAIFSTDWSCEGAAPIHINEQYFLCTKFSQSIELVNKTTAEELLLTNEFTPYSVEFSGNFIKWVEESNYKLLDKVPVIRVYDKDKNRVFNCKTRYRKHSSANDSWKHLNSSCLSSPGLIDIKVDFPDGHSTIETFYAIGDMHFSSCNETAYSTEIICNCASILSLKILPIDNVDVIDIGSSHWKISRDKKSSFCPSVCRFRIYNPGNPVLQLAIAIPFNGITIADVDGNIVPSGKILSFTNLTHFSIISHGNTRRKVDVSYSSDRIVSTESLKHLQSNVIEGVVSLSDYSDLILRMFNLYGSNSFDRSSSVVLNVSGQEIYVRQFVLETTINEGNIIISDETEEDTSIFKYEGDLYAIPVGEDVSIGDFSPVKLTRLADSINTFGFPESFLYNEVIVFSGIESRRRIIPKYYNRFEKDFCKDERDLHSFNLNKVWYDFLSEEDIMNGDHWLKVCKAYDICSHYDLPFTTYNGLKVIARSPKLLSTFIIAMWLNGYKDVLAMEIDRFEQELVIALHWIPIKIWEKSINSFLDTIPQPLLPMMMGKIQDFFTFIQELFNSTVSTDIASKLTAYIAGNNLEKANPISRSEIRNYNMKIRGLSDNNNDLPIARFTLNGNYYPSQSMLASYRVMIESAMCAAENTCDVKNHIDLFKPDGKEHARVVNFYRRYFKETYSEIYFRTVKLISNK